jgi:cytidylate kinase
MGKGPARMSPAPKTRNPDERFGGQDIRTAYGGPVLNKEMTIITISREMGSGGTALGRLLASALDYVLIDKEIILRAAQKARVKEETVQRYDQEVFNKGMAVLEGVFAMNSPMFAPLSYVPFPQDERLSRGSFPSFDQERYLAITQNLLRRFARRGEVVVLGRGGQCVLAGHKNALHLRVTAPFEIRVKRVCRSEGVTGDDARKMIKSRDQARARYLKHFYGRDWADPQLYDLVINTERLSLTAAAAMISGLVPPGRIPTGPARKAERPGLDAKGSRQSRRSGT